MKKALSLLLVVALTIALCGCAVYFRKALYPQGERYSVRDCVCELADVDAVVVSYSSGTVRCLRTEEEKITVVETAPESLPDEARMHWLLDGRTLRVQFCAPGFVGTINGEKTLDISLPDGLDLTVEVSSGAVSLDAHTLASVRLACTSGAVSVGSLSADTLALQATSGDLSAGELIVSGAASAQASSGDIRLGAVRAASLALETTSGDLSAEDATVAGAVTAKATSGLVDFGAVQAASLAISATSGAVSLRGAAQADSLQVQTTSGNIVINEARATDVRLGGTSGTIFLGLSSCETASVSSTSGNVSLVLREGLGATAEFSTSSGTLNSEDVGKKAALAFGDGSCAVTVSTTSGNCLVTEEWLPQP